MSLKQKVFLLIFGVLGAIIIAEIVLFCFGFFASSCSESLFFGKQQKEGIEVLCLGDSFTYGNGAGFSHSYPAQLEYILKGYGLEDINVFNGGMSGANSAIILAKLKLFLKYIEPDIIVVTAGRNDVWNYKQVNRFYNWQVGLKAFFSHSRLYNLLIISHINIRSIFDKRNSNNFEKEKRNNLESSQLALELLGKVNKLRSAGFLDQAIDQYSRIAKIYPNNISVLLEMARGYKLNKQYDEAVLILKKALFLDENNIDVMNELEDTFIGHKTLKQQNAFFYELIIFFPKNKKIKNRFMNGLIKLANEYYQKGETDKASVYYNQAIRLAPHNAKAYNNLFSNKVFESQEYQIKLDQSKSQGQFVWEITFDNLAEIADICNEREIPLILSGYPEEVYDAVITVAKYYKIIFVDQRDAFAGKRSLAVRNKYFIDDGHCTKQGYRIMAETLADKIIEVLK